MALGESSVGYLPAGRSTCRRAQSSCWPRPAVIAATSTSVKSDVARPSQADAPFPALALMSALPVGWSWRSRSPVEVPRKVLVSECSAYPYSFRPAAAAVPNASPSAGENAANTSMPVLAGASSQEGRRGADPPSMRYASGSAGPSSGCASSAGELSEAACSAASTTSATCSARTPARDTTPAQAPGPFRVIAMTVSCRDRDTPLVVSEFAAQRRFAEDVSSAITTQSSQRAAARARSTVSWGLMLPPRPY